MEGPGHQVSRFRLALKTVGSPERLSWGKAGGVLEVCPPPGQRVEGEHGGRGAHQEGKECAGCTATWKKVLTRDSSELNTLTDELEEGRTGGRGGVSASGDRLP